MKKFLSYFLIACFIAVGVYSCNCPANQTTYEFAKAKPVVHPEWSKNSTIYEVNLRQFTNEGTFKAFSEQLPRLKEMGVDILWFMPIHPIGELNRKGGLGSYYSVKDYMAVAPEYGTMDDFKAMVKQAHDLGMKVIIDWVANHTAWDNALTTEKPDFYTRDSVGNLIPPIGTDWSDVVDLNFDNMELRRYMIDALKFWVINADIDGFRCDVASWVPTEFWNAARAELDSIKPVFMLAEAEEPALQDSAFDAFYAWDLHHRMNQVAKGKAGVSTFDNYYEGNAKRFKTMSYSLNFTTNHDENSWNGTEFERMGNDYKLYSALCYTLPGMPLMYTGQESKLSKRLKFFEKDTIEWGNYPDAAFFTSLNKLKHETPALWNGDFGGDMVRLQTIDNDTTVYAFSRTKDASKVIAMFNFSDKAKKVGFAGLEGEYTEFGTGVKTIIDAKSKLALAPKSYKILVK